jgi:hypothetical protein
LEKFKRWKPSSLNDYLVAACLDLWSLSYLSSSLSSEAAPLDGAPTLASLPFNELLTRWDQATCASEKLRLIQIAGSYCYSNKSEPAEDGSFAAVATKAFEHLHTSLDGGTSSFHLETLSKSCSNFFHYNRKCSQVALQLDLDKTILRVLSDANLETGANLGLLPCFVLARRGIDVDIDEFHQVLSCFERRAMKPAQRRKLASLCSYLMTRDALKAHYRNMLEGLTSLCYDPIASENSVSHGRQRTGAELSPMAWTEDGNEIATQVFKFVAEVDDALHFWIQCYWVGPDAPLAMPKTLPSLLDLDSLGLAGITPAVLTTLTEADCDELLDHTVLKKYLQPHVMRFVSQIQLGEKVACETLQEHLVMAVRSVASDPEFIKLDEDGQSNMLHEWLEGYLDQAILVCRTEPNGSPATRCTLWPEFVSEVNSPIESTDTMQERITTLLLSAGVGIKPAPGHVRLYHKNTTNRTSRFLKYGLSHDLLTKRGDFNTAKAPGFYLFSSGSDALWHETTRSQDRMPSVQVQDTVLVFDVPRAQLEDWPHLTPAHRQEWQEWIIGCRTYLNDSALRKLELEPWRDGPHALETLDQVKNYLRRKVGGPLYCWPLG